MHAARPGPRPHLPGRAGGEAAWAGELDMLAPDHLLALINHFKGSADAGARPSRGWPKSDARYPDLNDIKGQETRQARARRSPPPAGTIC